MKTIKIILILLLFISFRSFSQENRTEKLHQLSGKIINKDKFPIPFVNIFVKNYRRGTISDFEGFFSLVVKANDTLLFSSMGYKKSIFIVPDTIKTHDFYIEIALKTDTVMLREALVLPWNTYEQFKDAFVKLNAPRDDIDRAIENFKKIEKQLLNEYPEADANLCYKQFMQQTYNQLYYAGQLPPNALLSPIAWSKFFKALRDGDLKNKKNN